MGWVERVKEKGGGVARPVVYVASGMSRRPAPRGAACVTIDSCTPSRQPVTSSVDSVIFGFSSLYTTVTLQIVQFP
ncbi:hypothetical protein J6590_022873 [Homalodisca vitripennis]|nr:hypothetical protein J6590_022873 [Homalodisca vitripennis]